MQSLLSSTCDLFSRIFEVFNEMEMEINVINIKNFTKFDNLTRPQLLKGGWQERGG